MVPIRKLSGARRIALPLSIEPQLATLRQSPPDGSNWLHEIKLDGYRMLCRIDSGKVSLITRQGHDWTKRLPEVAADLSKFSTKSIWLDGEIVALRPDGVSDFSTLQSAFRKKATSQLVYSVFDLLYLDGYDLRQCALPIGSGCSPRSWKGRACGCNMSNTWKVEGSSFSSNAEIWDSRAPFANGRIADISPAATTTGSKSNANGGRISSFAAISIRARAKAWAV
jgi:hypothetical protein